MIATELTRSSPTDLGFLLYRFGIRRANATELDERADDLGDDFDLSVASYVILEWRFTLKSVLCVLLLTLQIPSAYAAELPGDIAEGKRLHDANCKGCHDTSVYTRKDRQVGSLETLKEQMNSCGHVANKDFSAAEKQSMIKYLNNEFYHFQ